MFNVQMTFNNAGLFQLVNQLRDAGNSEAVSLTVATSLRGVVKARIHVDGVAQDGAQIGTYSDAYMKVRTGNYSNNKITRGKNKGRGDVRPNYNRGSDPKVIASLTRAMENSFAVVATSPTSYGLGYLNELSYNKSQWVEATYKGREIFSLTQEELDLVAPIVYTYLKTAIQ